MSKAAMDSQKARQWFKLLLIGLLSLPLVATVALLMGLHTYNGIHRLRAELLQRFADRIQLRQEGYGQLASAAETLGAQVRPHGAFQKFDMECRQDSGWAGTVTVDNLEPFQRIHPDPLRALGYRYWQFTIGVCEENGKVVRVFKLMTLPVGRYGSFSHLASRTTSFGAYESCRNNLRASDHTYTSVARAGHRSIYLFQVHQDEHSYSRRPLDYFDLRCTSYPGGCGEENEARTLLPDAWKAWGPSDEWRLSEDRYWSRRREWDCLHLALAPERR